MADKVIEVPGVGNVSFPDTMSDDQIAAAIQASIAPPPPAPNTVGAAAKGVALGLASPLTAAYEGLSSLARGDVSQARDLNKESTLQFFANALPHLPGALMQMGGEAVDAVKHAATAGTAEETGNLVGQILALATPALARVPSSVLPAPVQAAARIPGNLARGAVAGAAELPGARVPTRVMEAAREGYNAGPRISRTPTPLGISRSGRLPGEPPAAPYESVSPAHEPQPVSSSGELMTPRERAFAQEMAIRAQVEPVGAEQTGRVPQLTERPSSAYGSQGIPPVVSPDDLALIREHVGKGFSTDAAVKTVLGERYSGLPQIAQEAIQSEVAKLAEAEAPNTGARPSRYKPREQSLKDLLPASPEEMTRLEEYYKELEKRYPSLANPGR